MMARVFTGVKIVALLAISFCFVEAGMAFHRLSADVPPTLASIGQAANQINTTTAKVGVTFDAVNDQRPGRGTLNLLNKDLVNVKDLVQLASITAKTVADTSKQQAALAGQWDEELTTTLGTVNHTMSSVSTSVTSVSSSAKTAIDGLPVTLNHVNTTMDAVTNRVNDPAIPKITANVASMTDSGAHILKDGADETHKLVHPDKVKLGFWSAIDGGTLWVHSHIIPSLF